MAQNVSIFIWRKIVQKKHKKIYFLYQIQSFLYGEERNVRQRITDNLDGSVDDEEKVEILEEEKKCEDSGDDIDGQEREERKE